MSKIRGMSIDHATLQRWVVKFAPLIDMMVRRMKKWNIFIRAKDTSIKNAELHMRTATLDLKAQIEVGKINRNLFNKQQLSKIMLGKSRIPNLTWHHHQDLGRMQLVP